MSGEPTLLRDLIDIPERVQTNDFVLRLSDGVTEEGAAATIKDYVVTPQLADAFDHALGFIKGAITGRQSAASYLHGSFGSGKSHFMAILNLLLAGTECGAPGGRREAAPLAVAARNDERSDAQSRPIPDAH